MAALFQQKAATLEGDLRKAWFGEQLGYANAGKDAETEVPAQSYRLGVIVRVQPLRAGALIGGHDGGTPQRFLWMPTRDRSIDPALQRDDMEPLTIAVPGMRGALRIPPAARAAITAGRVAYNRHGAEPDHRLLAQLKVAAALMVLDAREHPHGWTISDDDWKLAEYIIKMSEHTRHHVELAAKEQSRRRNLARAADEAERTEYLSDTALGRAKAAILRRLRGVGGDGWKSHSDTYRECMRHRETFAEAIAELTESGEIEVGERNKGKVYRDVHPVYPVHPGLSSENGLVLGVYPVHPHTTQRNITCGNGTDRRRWPDSQQQATPSAQQTRLHRQRLHRACPHSPRHVRQNHASGYAQTGRRRCAPCAAAPSQRGKATHTCPATPPR